ncbi:MAG TPA: DUF192 domain-containing protein [Ignavibacteria bacterium]
MAKILKNNKKESGYGKFIFLGVLILIVGYFAITYFLDDRGKGKLNKDVNTTTTTQKTEVSEPQFRKQGELKFLSSNGKKEIRKIDVEFADKDSARMMGLMYRKSMEDTKGMLFIFETSEPHAFWMKNTIMFLDIIFVNENKEIVKIHKNTQPYSEKSLPSEKPSMYVVEVIAGFCEKYGVKEGDKIEFTKQ